MIEINLKDLHERMIDHAVISDIAVVVVTAKELGQLLDIAEQHFKYGRDVVADAWEALGNPVTEDSLADYITAMRETVEVQQIETNKELTKLRAAAQRAGNFSTKCSCEGTGIDMKPCAFHKAWLKSRMKLAEGDD